MPKHYSPLRRSSACIATPVTARLACVRHAASVQSEPGSNSSLEDFDNHQKEWIQNGPNLLLDILVTRSFRQRLETRVPTQITCQTFKEHPEAQGLGKWAANRMMTHSLTAPAALRLGLAGGPGRGSDSRVRQRSR